MNIFRQLLKVLLLVAGLAASLPALAATETENTQDQRGRLAIVIGNSNYESGRYEDLANASNDATRLSDALKRLNFEVATGIDMTSAQLDELFRRYGPSARHAAAPRCVSARSLIEGQLARGGAVIFTTHQEVAFPGRIPQRIEFQ